MEARSAGGLEETKKAAETCPYSDECGLRALRPLESEGHLKIDLRMTCYRIQTRPHAKQRRFQQVVNKSCDDQSNDLRHNDELEDKR